MIALKMLFMKTILKFCAISFAFSSSLSATELTATYYKDYLTKARLLKDDKKRLASYDKLADYLTSSTATENKTSNSVKPATPDTKGKWKIEEETSPMDDSKTVRLSLTSESYPYADLYFRYEEGKLEGFIATDEFLGVRSIRVTTRVDKKSPVTRSWSCSTNYKSVFHPNGRLLLNVLKKHQKLVVRLTPHGENTRTYTFDLTGLGNIADKLK